MGKAEPGTVTHDDRSLPGPALLFCPADRPERYAKALAAADGVILDLEDGVGASAKEAARAALLATPVDPSRVIVRVNGIGTPEHPLDMTAVAATGYRTLMLPKAESADQLSSLAPYRVVALVETAAGILAAPSIAAASSVTGLMWGAEDLMASMGGRSSRLSSRAYRAVAQHARSVALLSAAAAGKAAIDSVYIDIADLHGLALEAEDAAASGFAVKACIHPAQVPVVRSAFRADPDQVTWARRVLAAAAAGGAVRVDGQMIDAPLLRQAEAILASAR